MLKILGILLVVWLAFTFLGAVIEGLFWLTVVGVVLALGTVAYGAIKRRSRPELR